MSVPFLLPTGFLGETPSHGELPVVDTSGSDVPMDWSEAGTVPVMSGLTEIPCGFLTEFHSIETWKT